MNTSPVIVFPSAQLLRRAALLAAWQVCLAAAGCSPLPEPIVIRGPTMGTQYQVKILSPLAGGDVDRIRSEIEAVLDEINAQMSTYRKESEISQFNRHQRDEWFPVSSQFAAVVDRGLEISRETGGAFDMTVAPLVNLWQFGPPDAGRSAARAPSYDEIAAARESVGFEYIQVRDDPPALRKTRDGVVLDLSAIAKGYAVDRVAQLLDNYKLNDYLVEIGGELRARGAGPDGQDWVIGVENPTPGERTVYCAVPLRDASVATSGDYRNFRVLDGKRVSHMIDPRSGMPIEHTTASVTVVAADCATADAWATALMVLGASKGFDLAEAENLAVMFLDRTDQGIVERRTAAFHALADKEKSTR